ncbi:autophagy-related protein 22-like protein [Gongronella butleri]|nr:autophagy-related protein 22-like protein [Gongronella butleri]
MSEKTYVGGALDSQPWTTRRELWSYYLYAAGNNGHTMFFFMPTVLQYLGYLGGHRLSATTGDKQAGCDITETIDACYVSIASYSVPVSSMMLYMQAAAFFLQFLLLPLGSLGDYARYSHRFLLFFTVLGCFGQIAPVMLIKDDGSHWYIMAMLSILASIGYSSTLIFYAAIYPNISDHLPAVKHTATNLASTMDQIQLVKERARKQVSSFSVMCSSMGFLFVSVLLFGISNIPWSHGPFLTGGYTLGDTPMYNFIGTVVCGGIWVLLAIPYFLASPRGRRGPPFPANQSHWMFGWKSIGLAIRDSRQHRHLFLYMLANFTFSEAIGTIDQMMSIIQGEVTHFSTQHTIVMGILYGSASITGCFCSLWVSRRFKLATKTSLLIHLVATAMISLWGCMGIFSSNVGFRSTTELWFFSAWAGFFCNPLWAWQQTMLAELVQKGRENMYFSLCGLITRACSWVGPLIIGVIAQKTGNLWFGWIFDVVLFVIAITLLCIIDTKDAAGAMKE